MSSNRKPAEPVTFDIANSRDVVNKLVWEKQQVQAGSGGRAAKCYMAVNCASTAWHLHEWVWRDIKDRFELRADFAKRAGIAYNEFSADEFGAWLASTNQDLDICRAIATSAKHIGFDFGPAELKTVVSGAHAVASTVDEAPEWDSFLDVDTGIYVAWTLKIVVGERREPAIDLFDRVIGFWTQLIYPNQIGG